MFDLKKITRDNFIERLKARDERALNYVIDTYGGMIHAIVSRKLFSYPNQWEDCENDILLAVWNEIEHYDHSKNSFSGWLSAVCRYKSIDYLRRSARFQGELSLSSENNPDNLNIGSTELESSLEVQEAIQDLLHDLPENDRQLFWDCYVREKPALQIAREQNMKLSAFYNHLSRGRKKLKQYWEVKP